MKDFVLKYYHIAKKVERKYGVNAIVILAQASLESANGTSYSVKNRKNFFGITAFGDKNQYWNGEKSQSSSSGLWFRIYKTEEDSFMDFGRLIKIKYGECAKKSFTADEYAHCIAQSKYITDKFDDRESYEITIKKRSKQIAENVSEIEKQRKNKILSIVIISLLLITITTGIIIYKNKKK